MSINEFHVKELDHVRLDYKQLTYPQPNNDFLPRPYFLSLFVGVRNSGKTYSCVQMLKQYEISGFKDPKSGKSVPMRIILISPTFKGNPIWTSLKYLSEEDIHSKYTDETLNNILKDIKNEQKETKDYQTKLEVYKRFLKKKHLTQDEIWELEHNDYQPPTPPKYIIDPVIFLVLDDCVGASCYKSGKSPFTNVCLRNRHLKINILLLTQNLKAIQKSVRINCNLFVIYKFCSKKVIEDLYEEVANEYTESEFEMLYKYATDGEHNALVLDFTGKKEYKIRKNFNKILEIE